MHYALVLGLLASPVIPEVKTFKDWIVVCDNGLTCTATGEAFDSDGQGLTVRLTRGPLADDAPKIQFRAEGEVPSSATVQYRGFDLRNVDERGVLKAGDVAAFVALSRIEDSVSVFGSNNKMIGEVSLAGSTAAMLFMDEQQRRIGTTSALISRGKKKRVPAPPAIRVINALALSDAPPAPWKAEDAGIDLSCHLDPSDGRDTPIETYRLDARSTLVLVPEVCTAGAYNIDYSVTVLDNKGNPVPSQMEVPDAMDGEGGLSAATNAYYDTKTGQLGSSILCRGLGDCGVSRSFVWDGAVFRLVRQDVLGTGRGQMDPLTAWRSEVVRAEK
jgi:hypothetical protein